MGIYLLVFGPPLLIMLFLLGTIYEVITLYRQKEYITHERKLGKYVVIAINASLIVGLSFLTYFIIHGLREWGKGMNW